MCSIEFLSFSCSGGPGETGLYIDGLFDDGIDSVEWLDES
jgi:hypothetical protein